MSTRKIVVLTTSGHRQACGVEDRRDVLQDALCLRLEALGEVTAGRIEPDLARAEEEAVRRDPLAVRPDRGRRARRAHRLACHRWSLLIRWPPRRSERDHRARRDPATPSSVGGPARSRRIVVATTNGRPSPGRRSAPSARASVDAVGPPRRRPPPKDRGPSTWARSPTGRPAGPSSRTSARRRRRPPARPLPSRQQVVGRGEHTGALEQALRVEARAPLLGQVLARAAVCAWIRGSSTGRKRLRRPRPSRPGIPGHDDETPADSPRRGGSGVTRSPRPSTIAGAPARKNGTSEPRRRAIARRRSVVELSVPRLERGIHRRRCVRAPAEPGRDGDALLEPRRESGRRGRPAAGGAGPATAHGRPRLGDRPEHEVVGGRPGVDAANMERIARRPRRGDTATLSRSDRARGSMTEWRSW